MKKNKMMRLASVLLVAVLISTCAISGTFAKYVTNGTAKSEARVAKFGVKVAAEGNLFSTEYTTENTADVAKIGTNSVISSNEDKVVAPGTSGSLTKTMITGKPEVAVRVTNEATVTLENWTVEGKFYCPIVITVNGTDVDTSDCENAEQFASAVKTAIDATTAEYEANTDFGNLTEAQAAKGLSVSWKWPFYTDDGADKKDTALGDAAAGIPEDAQAATISINVTTTVTQID